MFILYHRYDVSIAKVGRCFVGALNVDLHGVWDRRRNLERFIVFRKVILKRAFHVTAYHTMRRKVEKRLKKWDSGRHGMLV